MYLEDFQVLLFFDVGGSGSCCLVRHGIWYKYSYRPSADHCPDWDAAFHGTWWYSLWLVAATGVLLASHDRDLGHDFNSRQGVFCSPSLATAERYARPCKPFPDRLYHRLVYELWVEPGKRVKRRNGKTVQWIVPQESVRLKGLWLRIDAPPEKFVQGWSVWKPLLEAKPRDATEPEMVDISDLPCLESFRPTQDDLAEIVSVTSSETEWSTETSSETAEMGSKTVEKPRAPKPKAMPKRQVFNMRADEERPEAPKPKAMPKRQVFNMPANNSERSLDVEEKPQTPKPKAMPKRKTPTTLAMAPGPHVTSEVRHLVPARVRS